MQNNNSKLKSFYFLTAIFIFSFFIFDFCQAATLYLEPQFQDVRHGDTFVEEIRINLKKGENINATEIYLAYPSDVLEAVDFSFGNSILTVIVQEPVINQSTGIISFSGGIPRGYSGRIPGDPGKSNLLGKIIFRTIGQNKAKIKFKKNSRVLLNNGLGTETDLSFQEANIKIENLTSDTFDVRNQWQKETIKDIIPPESFQPQIIHDSAIFDGQYALIFSTTDKQTGVDYYEIKEGDRAWITAKSPYLLVDQNLKSIIKVRVVDKAGNKRIEIVKPGREQISIKLYIISLILIVIGIIWWLIIRRRQKNK